MTESSKNSLVGAWNFRLSGTSFAVGRGERKTKVFVFDYDGTLTLDGGPIPETTKDMLKSIRAEGRGVLGVVSGRDLAFLKRVNSDLAGVFSFLVAENGAVTLFSDASEVIVRGREWSDEARKVFAHADFDIRFFEVIGSTRRSETPKVLSLLKESGLEAKIVPNKDSVMILPPNVDKGVGVAGAVAHLGATKDVNLTCFGDGENDLALFGPADTSVAVSNAVPELKKIADYVTSKPGGLGVEEYLAKLFGKIRSQ